MEFLESCLPLATINLRGDVMVNRLPGLDDDAVTVTCDPGSLSNYATRSLAAAGRTLTIHRPWSSEGQFVVTNATISLRGTLLLGIRTQLQKE